MGLLFVGYATFHLGEGEKELSVGSVFWLEKGEECGGWKGEGLSEEGQSKCTIEEGLLWGFWFGLE